jgi:hypothetical protein
MKKVLLIAGLGLLVLIIGGSLAVALFLDSAIKKGVETVGPTLTGVDVKLDSASVSLLSGSGKMKGLLVGNPEGYKTPSAISVGSASLAVSPGSIFSDKVVVKSINVQAPEITFETDLKGSNLGKILANLEASSRGPGEKKAPSEQAKPNKKLQVDEFIISGGKINVNVTALSGKSVTVPLPDIRLSNLGQGPEGITSAELTQKVLRMVLDEAIKTAGPAVTQLGKDALNAGKEAAVEKATKSLGDVLKKKK